MVGGASILVHSGVLVNRIIWEGKDKMAQFTDYGKKVKIALIKKGIAQNWLTSQITETTGLFVDNGYLYKILSGQRNAPKVVAAINQILGIEER